MKVDADGRPLVGAGAMMLGVRPTDPALPNRRADVFAAVGTDIVRPSEGGLSCYTDPEAITIQSKKVELWSLEERDLSPALRARPAGDPHYQIEPTQDMTLDQFQQMLAQTRDYWQHEQRGDGK
jgi:hypothetical protein